MTLALRRPLARPLGPEVIFDGRHLQVLHLPGDSDHALVTFHIMHAVADGRNAFAGKLATKTGIALYGVVPKAPNWYPAEEAAEAAALIRARLDRPALAYGASMGGYGALRWGRAAGCIAALAFSPQGHIDPAVTGEGDRRYARYHDPALHRDMAIRPEHLAPLSYALVDPGTGPDLIQIALLPKVETLTLIDLSFMGHKTAGAIASSVLARQVFAAAMGGDAEGIARALGRNRKNAVSYHANLARACLANGHAAWALSILTAARLRFLPDADLDLATAEAHQALGQFEAATALLRALVAKYPGMAKFRLALMRALQRSRPEDVTDELLALAEIVPTFPMWLKVVKTLRREDRLAEAAVWHARTALRWPDQAALLPRLT